MYVQFRKHYVKLALTLKDVLTDLYSEGILHTQEDLIKLNTPVIAYPGGC